MLPPELLFIIFGFTVEKDVTSIKRISLACKLFRSIMLKVHAKIPNFRYNKCLRHDEFVNQIFCLMMRHKYIKGIENIVTQGMQYSSLYISAEEKNWKMVDFFLKKGADPCFRTEGIGFTLIHKLVEDKAPIEILEKVLKKISKTPEEENHLQSSTFGLGNTPLHTASEKGHLNHLQLLLRFGADKSITNGLNKTPLDIALETGNAEIIRVLQ
jgi:ankyrin repeat protein